MKTATVQAPHSRRPLARKCLQGLTFSVLGLAAASAMATEYGRVIRSAPITSAVSVPQQVCSTQQEVVRQPGSGFKPFLYSAALEHGFTPSSILMDAPIVLDDAGMEQAWRPENSGGDFSGPIRLREALVRSRNLVSIRLLRSIGPDVAIDYAARFGFDPGSMPHNLTLALGTLPATPLLKLGRRPQHE